MEAEERKGYLLAALEHVAKAMAWGDAAHIRIAIGLLESASDGPKEPASPKAGSEERR